MQIETPTPFIWKNKNSKFDTYSQFDMERMKILATYFPVWLQVSEKGINSIPWKEIPDEMWNQDHNLPLQLEKIKNDLNISGVSLYSLLRGAILKGKNALAYRLIGLSIKGLLTKEIFTLMAESVPGDPVIQSCVQLFEEAISEKISEFLPFLQEKEWAGFNHMLLNVEAMFAFPSLGSLDERLKKLPNQWKVIFIKFMQMGRSQKEIIEPLLKFIQGNPQPEFINFLFKVISETKAVLSLEIIQLFNHFPKEEWYLDNSYQESTKWEFFAFIKLVKNWCSKYQEKIPIAIAHLLTFPGSLSKGC
jgi:hypothetical protein